MAAAAESKQLPVLACAGCKKPIQFIKKSEGGVEKDQVLRCGGCKAVYYCSADCQKKHWAEHKKVCKALKELAAKKTGFSKEIIKEGEKGKSPKVGQEVVVNYTGTLADGTVFDASEKHGKPFSFVVGIGQVIRGWDMGIMEMTKGEKARLFISPEFGYGDAGAGSIPPNAPLVFEVELLEFRDAELTKTGTNFL